MFENIGHGLESSRTGEATSGRNRGAAVELSGRNRGAAVEEDTIGKQQLKRTQSGSSSSAQRAVRRRITLVGKQGGSS